jgi:hypothetical protein
MSETMKTAIAATAMIAAMAAFIANVQSNPANDGTALADHTADLFNCWQSKEYDYALRTNERADVAADAVYDMCDMQHPIENYGLSPSILKIYKNDRDHLRAEARQESIGLSAQISWKSGRAVGDTRRPSHMPMLARVPSGDTIDRSH